MWFIPSLSLISEQPRRRRLFAGQPVAADHPRLPRSGVVVGDGPGVAPMAVEVVLAVGRAPAAHVEEQLRALEGRFDGDELGLGDGDGRRGQGVTVVPGRPRRVEGLGGEQYRRPGGVAAGRDLTDGVADVGIVDRARGAAVLDGPGPLAGEPDGVVEHGAGQAGLDGGEIELRGRRERIAATAIGAVDLVRRDPDVGEPGAAACGHPLADGVEIVDALDALAVGRDGKADDLAVVVGRRAGEPVRVQPSGAVVLGAADDEFAAPPAQAGRHRSAGHAALVGRPGEDVAGQDPFDEPRPGVRFGQPGRSDRGEEATTQGLRDVRVGPCDVDDDLEQLPGGGAGPAVDRRDAEPQHTGLGELLDLRVRELTPQLPAGGTGFEVLEHGRDGGAYAGHGRVGHADTPAFVMSRPGVTPRPGMAAISSRVYSSRGSAKISPTGPSSTMRPPRITLTVWAIRRTTPRSWVMNR